MTYKLLEHIDYILNLKQKIIPYDLSFEAQDQSKSMKSYPAPGTTCWQVNMINHVGLQPISQIRSALCIIGLIPSKPI